MKQQTVVHSFSMSNGFLVAFQKNGGLNLTLALRLKTTNLTLTYAAACFLTVISLKGTFDLYFYQNSQVAKIRQFKNAN